MKEKSVIFISGVSSGIGYQLVRWFCEDYLVVGTVRDISVKTRLEQEFPDSIFLIMDLTEESSIESAFQRLSEILNSRPLFALINNAGIAVPGPIAYLDSFDWERQFKTNVIGLASCIRYAYPLLLKGVIKGRIINVGSVSGLFASPFLGAYAASKFAVEGLTDSLRRESLFTGIKVVLIEPGPVKTDIWSKSMGLAQKFKGTEFEEITDRADEIIRNVESTAMPPQKLHHCFTEALKARRPKHRYLVHKHPFLMRILAYFVPSRWTDWMVARQFKAKKNNFRPI